MTLLFAEPSRHYLRLAILLLFMLDCAVAFAKGIPELGDPPTAPTTPLYRQQAGGPAISPFFSVTTTNREEARNLFNAVYTESDNIDSGWAGDVANCVAGTTTAAFRDKVMLRVNYFRAMAGVPAWIVSSDSFSADNQAAALMMSKANTLSHFPPSNFPCFTAAGAAAAGNSNLSLGDAGPEAIDGYMKDAGANNTAVGHRRWLIFPQTRTMGSGDVFPEDGVFSPANTTYVIDGNIGAARPTTRQPFVAWPPPGFVPFQVTPIRWSFSFPNANFNTATVTMSTNGVAIPVSLETIASGFGENALVWHPADLDPDGSFDWPNPTNDTTFTVTIQNVVITGITSNFTYTVTVFDPAVPGPDTVLPAVSGPDQAGVGVANSYSFTPVPTATGYQWRQALRAPFTATDGAESGLANFTASISTGYNPIVSSPVAAGTHAFHLATLTPTDQTLTLNRILVPGANSALKFKSRLGFATSAQVAHVQVSINEGTSWQDVYTQAGTGGSGEASFTLRTIALTNFTGRSLMVRFQYAFDTGSFFNEATSGVGWYLDDISFVNTEELTSPTITNVITGTAFDFTPATLTNFALQVRAAIFTNFHLEWGPVKPVTGITAVIDTVPPGLTILTPVDNQVFTNTNLTVSGIATDAVTVTVNGATASLTGTNWSHPVTLQSGTNTFLVIATDGSANTATQIVHALYTSNAPPAILTAPNITNPALQFNQRAIVVAGDPIEFAVAAAGSSTNTLNFQWVFGDGITSAWSTVESATHVYSNCGPFTATVAITDGSTTTRQDLALTVPCTMVLTNMSVKLNFAKTGAESAAFRAILILPGNFSVTNRPVLIDVGDAQVPFTLNAKGKGTGTNGTVQFTFNKRTLQWTCNAQLKNGNWKNLWADFGLLNTNTPPTGTNVFLPVFLLAGDEAFLFEKPLTYKAKAGKTGAAK